ncbi:hypothetical protein HDU91_003695, partial [Kappamyces sp. JEL0680]
MQQTESPFAKVIIAPHAGYSYSGPVAAFAYAQLAHIAAPINTVFLLGPSHRAWLSKGAALSSCSSFETPLGDIDLDLSIVADLKSTNLFDELTVSVDEAEHSLEMHLPYILKAMKNRAPETPFKLVPIMIGSPSRDVESSLASVLLPYLVRADTLFVLST